MLPCVTDRFRSYHAPYSHAIPKSETSALILQQFERCLERAMFQIDATPRRTNEHDVSLIKNTFVTICHSKIGSARAFIGQNVIRCDAMIMSRSQRRLRGRHGARYKLFTPLHELAATVLAVQRTSPAPIAAHAVPRRAQGEELRTETSPLAVRSAQNCGSATRFPPLSVPQTTSPPLLPKRTLHDQLPSPVQARPNVPVISIPRMSPVSSS